MKMNKLFSAIFGTALLAGAWACTDEVKYNPAPKYDGDEVFFSTETTPEELQIPYGASEVNVQLERIHTEAELTVGLSGSVIDPEGTDMSAVFGVPTQITFPAGEKTVEIPISVVFSDVAPTVDYVLNIAVEGEQASPYGPTVATIILSYAPWTEWEEYSTAEYTGTMGNPWPGEPLEGIALRRNSVLDPNQEQWGFPGPRYSNLYFDYILTIDKTQTYEIDGEKCYKVTMPLTDTHFDNGEDRIMLMDAFSWMRAYGAENGDKLSDASIESIMANNGFNRSYYNEKTGTFKLWLVPCVKGDELARYSQSYTTLQLPGFTFYSIDFAVLGSYVDPKGGESLVISATRSSDLASFAYNIVPGALTKEQVEAEAKKIKDNTEAELYVDETRNILFPFTEEGQYTLVAVGYEADGNAVYETSFTFDAASVQVPSEWKSIGYADYTDTFIYDLYNGPDDPEEDKIGGETWSVEVQEHKETPGYYRLVNPYLPWLEMMGAPNNYLDGNYYLYVNAQDKSGVYLELSELGAVINPSEGQIIAWSLADFQMEEKNWTLAQCKAQGLCGTFEDGMITFPADVLLMSVDALFQQGKFGYANSGEFFCIDFNAAQGAPAKVKRGMMGARTASISKALTAKAINNKSINKDEARHLVLKNKVSTSF
ncbi:MAG: hypothetical protein NC418_05995 [Muribaculaceae bacterium]|nr:hypothetical protein [Muribaculaceae bacterium]